MPIILHCLTYCFVAPHQYSQIPFKLKALKIILNHLQANGESATLGAKNTDYDNASSVGVRVLIGHPLYILIKFRMMKNGRMKTALLRLYSSHVSIFTSSDAYLAYQSIQRPFNSRRMIHLALDWMMRNLWTTPSCKLTLL
jgi:hypothetical protein